MSEESIDILIQELSQKFPSKSYKINQITKGGTFHIQVIQNRIKKVIFEVILTNDDYISITNSQVPYGSVSIIYNKGMVEQFSPFDDNTTAVKVNQSLNQWIKNYFSGGPRR